MDSDESHSRSYLCFNIHTFSFVHSLYIDDADLALFEALIHINIKLITLFFTFIIFFHNLQIWF